MAERVLICGDRNWRDYQLILDTLSAVQLDKGVEVVIEGEAKGADEMGRSAATRLGIPVQPYMAEWKKFGLRAGPVRNLKMLEEGRPTLVLAFHDYLEGSKGTKNMVAISRAAGVPVRVITGRKTDDLHRD